MKYLIWDFDGTLGYREGGWTGTLAEVIRRHCDTLAVTPDQIRPYLQSGYPWHTPELPHLEIKTPEQWWDRLDPVFEQAFEKVGVAPSRIAWLVKQVRLIFSEVQFWQLFEDTIPVLDDLSSRGWQHLILSNHVPELKQIIHSLGLEPFISKVFNSADIGYEKPHPQAFQKVIEAIGKTERIWMIGDSINADISGAQAIGLSAILVRKPHQDAKYFAEDLFQIVKFIDT